MKGIKITMEDKKYNGLDTTVYTKAFAIFNICCFLSFIVIMAVLTYLSPKEEFSQIEKRELAKLPQFSTEDYFSGEYTEGLSMYYRDNFVFRDGFVALTSQLEEMRGYRYEDVKIHSGASSTPATPPTSSIPSANEDIATTTNPETTPSPEPTPTPEDDATGQQLGATFIYKNRGLAIFGGSASVGQWYADTIDSYLPILGEDVQIYNMIVPTSIEFYLPDKYSDVSHPQEPAIDTIYNALDSQVISVDAYSQLEAHKDEYIYFNTDHHWTALGAYYGYTAFAQSAGFEPIALEELETTRIEDFVGTLYAWTQDQSLLENIDYLDYYTIDTPHTVEMYLKDQPYYPVPTSLYAKGVKGSNAYMVFIHGDQPMMKITTEIQNNRKIMIVKESYANAFIPFLVNHYQEIYVVDGRYVQQGIVPIIENNQINELLFLNNIMSAYTPYNINRLETIKYQVWVPPTPAPTPTPVPEEVPLEESTEELTSDELPTEELPSEDNFLEDENFSSEDT